MEHKFSPDLRSDLQQTLKQAIDSLEGWLQDFADACKDHVVAQDQELILHMKTLVQKLNLCVDTQEKNT